MAKKTKNPNNNSKQWAVYRLLRDGDAVADRYLVRVHQSNSRQDAEEFAQLPRAKCTLMCATETNDQIEFYEDLCWRQGKKVAIPRDVVKGWYAGVVS